jgi:hypothetical protein
MRDGRLIAGREPATDGARCLYRRPDGTHYLLGASGGAELAPADSAWPTEFAGCPPG